MAAPGMLYCPKCAAPLDEAERARLAIQEQHTRDEVAELRTLLEKYLQRAPIKDGTKPSTDVPKATIDESTDETDV
jgi:hypothetical protein